MCGIAGIYKGKLKLEERDRSAVLAMMQSLEHRGPDDEGHYFSDCIALGHRRLSIIDLEGGHQPMSNAQGSIWVILNGEIYNYIELRDELISLGYNFTTQSDTEVLIRMYEEYGPKCVERLNGMFAFAIWDDHKKLLVLCRDRLGIKPLYYHYDGKVLSFASEIKAFIKSGLITPELNENALHEYIVLQLSLGNETIVKGIKKLMPGQMLLADGESLEIRKYWQPAFLVDPASDIMEGRYVNDLTSMLEDSLRMQIRSDVPVGAHLSGGMDSSAVCSLASRYLGKDLDTFTGYFNEGAVYDESSYAKLVNERYGYRGHLREVNAYEAAENLERIIYHMDEPQAGPGVIPQYFISNHAKEHVKVVLSGLGGDEIFGGYAKYYLLYLEECLKGAIDGSQLEGDDRFVVTFESMLPNLPLMREYIPMMKKFWSEGLFDEPAKRYFRLMRRDIGSNVFSKDVHNNRSICAVEDRFASLFNSSNAASLLNRALEFDLKVFIPALLQVEDRTSMAVSLESRVPLLDHRIVEFAAKMPPKIKWRGGRPKYILRESLKEVVPPEIWSRTDKRGFPTPIAEWFNGPLRGYVREILGTKKARERGIYNYGALELEESAPFDRSLWGALCIELWYNQFID